ncbi:hypothetical protein BOQ60_26545, partial [Chryseobacterium sp. CH1]
LYADFNTKFGDLSAILIDNLPFWVEITTTPSKKVSLMGEWESKLKVICRFQYKIRRLIGYFN